MRGLLVGLVLAAAETAAIGQVMAAGSAIAVVQQATATSSGSQRVLQPGARISMGEVIQTGSTGEVQLLFDDQTKMVVGPNSRLVIEAALFQGQGASRFAVNALGGAFRFISGRSGSAAYTVRTPTSTMGVRGTAFDFTVDYTGTNFALLQGRVRFCGRSGQCAEVARPCAVLNAGASGAIGEVRSQETKRRLLRARFPYIVSQQRLRPAFRSPVAACGNLAAAVVPGGLPAQAPATAPAPFSSPTPPATPPGMTPEPPSGPVGGFPGQSGRPGNANSAGRGGGVSEGQSGQGVGDSGPPGNAHGRGGGRGPNSGPTDGRGNSSAGRDR